MSKWMMGVVGGWEDPSGAVIMPGITSVQELLLLSSI